MVTAPAQTAPVPVVVRVLLDPEWAQTGLVREVRAGLEAVPRRLTPQWLYDERGSELFDRITRLPEYYPTRREREILERHAGDIAVASRATALVELGSGSSEKTRLLLDAFTARGDLRWFVPVDVSESTLRRAAADVAAAYPGLAVEAVVADFTAHLDQLPHHGRRLVAFLGGTIGNFAPAARAEFLRAVAHGLEPGEGLLLGTDLVKSADRLIAAYDDSEGITEEFIRNALVVIDRELGATFDPAAFTYVPFWDAREQRMDLRLRSTRRQHVRVPGADLEFDLADGEELHVEISTKFMVDGVRAELDAAGFDVAEVFTDEAGDFALTLAARRA